MKKNYITYRENYITPWKIQNNKIVIKKKYLQ